MPLRLSLDYYSNLAEKFRSDNAKSGAWWAMKHRYVELYDYAMELRAKVEQPQTEPQMEIPAMVIKLSREEVRKILEAHLNERMFKASVIISDMVPIDEGSVPQDFKEMVIEVVPSSDPGK